MFDPNDCPYLAEVLALWEEELPAGRAAEVRAHAAVCPECRSELRELRRCSELLRDGDPAAPVPAARQARLKDDLLRRAAADLQPTPAPRRRATPDWLPWLGLAAAAGMAAMVLFGPRAQPPTPAPAVAKAPALPRQPLPLEEPDRPAPAPADRATVKPLRAEPVLVHMAPTPKPVPRPWVPAPRAERRIATAPAEPAPRERLVIDVRVPPQPELPPSGTLTLIATGATGSSDATRVILRTVEEETP